MAIHNQKTRLNDVLRFALSVVKAQHSVVVFLQSVYKSVTWLSQESFAVQQDHA